MQRSKAFLPMQGTVFFNHFQIITGSPESCQAAREEDAVIEGIPG